jgi:Arc/MetJ family transcription regulator
MRRTVVIDDKLLEEAQKALGTRGVRDTVEAGLRKLCGSTAWMRCVAPWGIWTWC